jgi:hypothetical protein
MWFHYRLVGTGRFHVSSWDPDEIREEELVRETHWGRREKCAKCRKHRLPVSEFKNRLSEVGYIVVGLPLILVVVAGIVLFALHS